MKSCEGEILWRPTSKEIADTRYAQFVDSIGVVSSVNEDNAPLVYQELHRWSLQNPGLFWRRIWDFANLKGSLGDLDFDATQPIWNRPFFPLGSLNFAENLLQPDRCQESDFAESTAIIVVDETGKTEKVSRAELLRKVAQVAGHLRHLGVEPGDRVAALLPNRLEAVIAFLAVSSLGAIWSCCSPDFGDDALLDRFAQIEPKVLVASTNSRYAGKCFLLSSRVEKLAAQLPTVKHCILVDSSEAPGKSLNLPPAVDSVLWSSLENSTAEPLFFKPFPFNQPLYILYSSGTTGKPKCIVHGAGGSLIQHVKEHALHLDVRSEDVMFYYTGTGWMMWNWLVSALAVAKTIVLYDGSPIAPNLGSLWKVSAENGVTHLGASARYYAALEKENFVPKHHSELGEIRCVMSTGSPLLPEQFGWIYRNVSDQIQVASISGGTDIVSCFVLGNPTLPVHAGEIQCRGLGMDVRVWDSHGNDLVGHPGELVCANAFPSMPIGFWNDPDRSKFRSAYFSRYENVWWHGDWTKETVNGGFIIYGRSDATLNPGGVRIGTGEIYQQVEAFLDIAEAVATVLRRDGDERIVLFVKMQPGKTLTSELIEQIKLRLRTNCSPRHVPAYVVSVPDLPKTLSGKISEIAVRNALIGTDIGNVGALANPICLDFFSNWAKNI